MTRVVLDIDAMTAAGERLTLVAEDLEQLGSALRAGQLPDMPPAMATRYAGAIAAVSQRAAGLGAPVAAVGAELRRRALEARTAAGAPGDDRGSGRRVASAVAPEGSDHQSSGGDLLGSLGTSPEAAAPATGHEAVRHHAAHAVHDAVAGDVPEGGDLRATAHDGAGALRPTPMPDADHASEQQWACWMASQAAHDDLPPALPVALALANSGMRNLDAHGAAVGMFGIAPGHELAPAGFGLGATARPDEAWWQANPDAQLEHVLRRLSAVAPQELPSSANELGDWAAEAQGGTEPGAVAETLTAARALVARCRHGAGDHDGAPQDVAGGARGVVSVASSQLGVRETAGDNAGPEVNRYLASAGTAPGNPWCASFVTWAMRQSGHPMEGGGWAAVAHWVGAAQQHTDGLQLVDAAHARPGDVVAYDWGGGSDFGADGHIGILASTVGADGAFETVEGNAGDAVARMQRRIGQAAIVFIRSGAAP